MQFTQRQRLSRGIGRPLLVVLAVGLLLGFAGPFGSSSAYPTATRYAFWLVLTAVGAGFAGAAAAVIPADRFRAGMIRIVVVGLASAMPMIFVVAWTISLLQPGRVFAPQQLPALFAAVAAVQLMIAYALALARPPSDDAQVQVPAPPSATESPAFPAALLSRLPQGIGRDILALETEDHYLRVHTEGGSALILMRMADAVAMLDPRLGAQVHRRWWVAEAAVAEMGTEGQKLVIRLKDGSAVPVGRTFAAATRARFAPERRAQPASA